MLFNAIVLANIIAFAAYGCLAIFSNHMVEEFNRYGLTKWRFLVGVLEVMGAIGQLVGLFYAPLMISASAGLGLLMLLGVATRIRVGDPVVSILPALILMVVNVTICAVSWISLFD